jgi:hypothetical protein
MFTNIPGMCDRDQKDGFWCPSTGVFGTASIVWGVIGPARQFSQGQIYYCTLVSIVLIMSLLILSPSFDLLLLDWFPLPARRLARTQEVAQQLRPLPQVGLFYSQLRRFLTFPNSFPVIFSGTGAIPPASAINYVPWAIVGFVFQYVVRRRHFAWWTKYNCGSFVSLAPVSF